MTHGFLNPDSIVYVDVEFIAQKYEEVTGIPAQSVMTRTEGGQAGVRIPFASAGVHTQESRSYPVSSTKMLQEVFDKLKTSYGSIDFDVWENGKGSCLGWIKGSLTVGEWVRKVNQEEKERHKYYELHCGSKRVCLLPRSDYFYPGFSDLLAQSEALMSNIDFPVLMLVRALYYAQVSRTHVCVPLLALENGTAGM